MKYLQIGTSGHMVYGILCTTIPVTTQMFTLCQIGVAGDLVDPAKQMRDVMFSIKPTPILDDVDLPCFVFHQSKSSANNGTWGHLCWRSNMNDLCSPLDEPISTQKLDQPLAIKGRGALKFFTRVVGFTSGFSSVSHQIWNINDTKVHKVKCFALTWIARMMLGYGSELQLVHFLLM